MIQRLNGLGFDNQEAFALRRIAMTFSRWDEAECGDSNDYASFSVERDEETGKPYRVIMPHSLPPSQATRYAIPDREAGAQRRLDKIMTKHPELAAYHQGDCRGASLYIVKRSDLNGSDIHSTYTRGVAVYK
jgi:hypothetical protein